MTAVNFKEPVATNKRNVLPETGILLNACTKINTTIIILSDHYC